MSTECRAERFAFARVEGRSVVATFDGGKITSDAGQPRGSLNPRHRYVKQKPVVGASGWEAVGRFEVMSGIGGFC